MLSIRERRRRIPLEHRSFFYPENTSSITVQLVVNLSGRLLDADLNFGLKLVEEGTTALPGEYKLEESYVFHRKPVEEGAKEIKVR